ncbi:glycosyltransferase family 39 protein [Saccharata proteae CBS 121410]|uniref:Dolichyl-phosphate-mannose--protein mannosyltransferase n=1 Tax=Saccharata proteae CBS 121410 TaxID=1314787 RepID=A0A9P4HZ37_9PEZI|nr:glycosyltransferase family 39 protein [Saccharata proteae CBS 121410]
MTSKAPEQAYLQQKPPNCRGKSPGRSPARNSTKAPKGKTTDYTSVGVKDNDIFKLPGSDWQLLGLLTVVAAAVRLFRIYQPSSVVFDEVHFGGFASKYIKGKFFMDVHPPLAKLLITLAGWLAGFNGDFEFKNIGDDYLEPGVPYVAMRLLPAIMGVLTIPTMFLTLKAAGCQTNIAALGAGLVIFENGLLTQSRLILLDSPLVIFTAITALAWTCFTNQHEQGPSKQFKPSWWFWLAATGLGLGATASVKWVGLFTIAWVGSLTVLQLWVLLGDSKNITPRLWFKHFFARFFCLIIIPVGFYMAMFAIHFLCLVNPGDGDGFMSSEFQSTLNSKGMQDVPADVAFGSRISLRHHNTQGGYLHSHVHMYPGGSQQQQITLYPHKDENNLWLIENQTQPLLHPGTDDNTTIPGPLAWDQGPPALLEDGSIIKLYHIITDRRLHSHDVRAPVTEADWQNEVSAYGYEGFEGDANDLFKVEIVKQLSDGPKAQTHVRTIETKFRLVHIMTGCTLFSHKVKLPDWGYEQQEVTCARGGTLPNSIWYVEQNEHPALGPDSEKVNYKNPGFFGKFWELQKVMWKTNAGLVESHAWDSRPPSWPVLRRGINFWGKDHRQVYLTGNPIIWWSSTLAILAYVAVKGLAVLRWQRGYKDYDYVNFKRFDYEIGMTALGWAFHYFPFYLMQRQLFLHHYFPALYFAIMALCQTYDFLTNRFGGLGLRERPVIGQTGAVAFLAVSVFVFTLYAPLAYGNPWTQDQCKAVKLFDTWDWDCNTFYKSYDQYATVLPSVKAAAPPSPPPANIQPEIPQEVPQEGMVTPQPEQPEGQIMGSEQKVEYRDEQGNILDEEMVKSLEGKVSFKTRYETRTRLVDAAGNEIAGSVQPDNEGIAPPHPDYDGPGTAEKAEGDASEKPPVVSASEDEAKESSAESKEKGTPRPGSEAKEATK